ncbi:MAG: ABC transporter permease [Micromonosporaceae bacterium]
MIDQVRAIYSGFRLQFAESSRSPMTITTSILQPLAYASLLLLARTSAPPEYAARVVASTVMMSLWALTLFSAGTALLRDRMAGTIGSILVRPAPIAGVLFGRSLCVAVVGIVTSGPVTVAVLALGRTHTGLPPVGVSLALAVVAVLSAACVGLLLSALMLVTRGAPRLIEALIYLVFALGGLLVPTELLPTGMRWFAEVVSLHHVVEMAQQRALVPSRLAAVAALSAGYLLVGLWVMRGALRRARREATIELT